MAPPNYLFPSMFTGIKKSCDKTVSFQSEIVKTPLNLLKCASQFEPLTSEPATPLPPHKLRAFDCAPCLGSEELIRVENLSQIALCFGGIRLWLFLGFGELRSFPKTDFSFVSERLTQRGDFRRVFGGVVNICPSATGEQSFIEAEHFVLEKRHLNT